MDISIWIQTIDNIYNYLEELENQGDFTMHVENQIQNLKFELRNLRIHFKWDTLGTPYSHDQRLWVEDVKRCLHQPATQGMMTPVLLKKTLSKLLHRVTQMKTRHFSYHNYNILRMNGLLYDLGYKNTLIADVLGWIDQLLDNLNYLIQWNNLSSVLPTKEQIETLVEKARFLRNFLKIAEMGLKEAIENGTPMLGPLHKTPRDLLNHIKRPIYKTTYLSWFSLIDEKHRYMDKFLLISLANMDHIEPEIRMIYVQLLKASKIANQGTLGIDLQALATVDSLLDNLEKLRKDQDNDSFMHLDVHEIEILCQELSFLKYFLIDPLVKQHNEVEGRSFVPLLIEFEARAKELGAALNLSNCFGRTEVLLAHEMHLLHTNLLNIVKLLKLKIREMYLSIPRQSTSNFPRSPKLGLLDFFLQNLEDLLLHKADSIAYVENEVRTLQGELTLVNSFIRDTTKNFDKNENIARCIMDVAYEAQQVIDLISGSHFPKWYYILWLSDIIEKIKILNKDCSEVQSKMSSKSNNVENTSSTINPNRGYITSTEEEMVGFHAEAEGIIDQLTRGTKQLDIVSIVGMAGLGKTTLAKKVYEHPSITRYFHIRSWYCISQEYNKQDLLCSILNDLQQRLPESKDQDKAQELYKSLKGRRYLIVLDDIWSIEPWNDIKSSFPDDYNGSRILFTSRNRAVANTSCSTLDLRFFSNDESWELLKKKVFQSHSCPQKLQTIGKKIAANCKGLPLSVVLLAGVLVKQEKSEDPWKQVLASLGKQVGDLSNCILELSYKELPDHLKPCFLYFGAFPEDKAILTQNLIRLWIAEGFIQKKTMDESLENVAEGYLMDLIARNLVLISHSKSIGGVKSCHVHDLLHEFSKKKVKDENFFQISKKMPDGLEQYRLCFYLNKSSFCGWIPCNPYVRSIFFHPTENTSFPLFDDRLMLLYSLKLLTILDIRRIAISDYDFQRMTGVLVHLRYLAIKGPRLILSSVANIWRLETFILSGFDVVSLSEALLEMAYLKHVHVNGYVRLEFSDHTEKSIKSGSIEKFSTLRFNHCTMEKVIRRLRNLRKLKCQVFEIWNKNGICRDQFPELELLNMLESLNMEYCPEGFVFHGVKSHSEFNFPSNLKKLTLKGLCLPWSEISKIRRLPQLKVLKLLKDAFKGRRWDANDDEEFWNLKYLKLEWLNIEEWDASPDVFPCLEKLVVHDCWQLKEIPSSFGGSSTLQMIDVKSCRRTVTKVLEIEKDNMGAKFKVVIQYPIKKIWNQNLELIQEISFQNTIICN